MFLARLSRCVDGTRKVKSNRPYWSTKISGNRERDARHAASLRADDWKVFTVWECQARDQKHILRLVNRIKRLPIISGR
jgi:DNA mismatch endonuclease, patch repair protein